MQDKRYINDPFDELFADSAERQHFPMPEEAWLDMESRLDHRDKKRRYRLFFALFGVLVLSILTFAVQEKTKVSDALLTPHVVNDQQDFSAIERSPLKASGTITSEETTHSLESLAPDRLNSQITTSKATSKNAELVNDLGSLNRDITAHSTLNVGQPSNTSPGESLSALQNVKDDTNRRTRGSKVPISPLALSPLEINHNRAEVVIREDVRVAETPSSGQRLAVSVHAAPEWSSVGLSSTPILAWRTGVDLAYPISDRWEVSLGLAYSKKKYAGEGSDYTNTGGWLDDISPQSMKAKCFVLDIPLMARRYLTEGTNDRWYIEGGLSNYFVTSEWYGFDYSPSDVVALSAAGMEPVREITIDQSDNRHWIGVGQLSFGYQRKVSNKYHISIAPYISIPLTGIGEGKVSLYSSGIRFLARYQM